MLVTIGGSAHLLSLHIQKVVLESSLVHLAFLLLRRWRDAFLITLTRLIRVIQITEVVRHVAARTTIIDVT